MAVAGSAVPGMKLKKTGDREFRIENSCMMTKSVLPSTLSKAKIALDGEQPAGGYVIMSQHVHRLRLKGFEITG